MICVATAITGAAHFNVPRLNVPTIQLRYWIDLGPRRLFAIARLKQVAALFAQANESSLAGKLAAASAATQLQDLLLWLATISQPARRRSRFRAKRRCIAPRRF